MSLTPSGQSCEGAAAGIVEASVFFGSTNILLVRLKRLPNVVLRVQMPAGQATAFEQGSNVDILIDETRLQTFPIKEGFAA